MITMSKGKTARISKISQVLKYLQKILYGSSIS